MTQSWSSIVEFYRGLSGGDDVLYRQAVEGVGAIARYIGESQRLIDLHGWTSMHDLCIQQTEQEPYSGPFLRISPLHSGNVEFRYLDTLIAERQWHREVPASETVARFLRFLDGLRWFGGLPIPD